MILFTQFRKSFGARIVLSIAEFEIHPGIYWIKGSNGSGKSTLLKSMAGIIGFEGDIFLNINVSLKRHPVAYRQQINFAEAEPLFPEFLTGIEMIKLFTTAKKAPLKQEEFYIESMKMNSYIDQPIGTYSTGMLKKLSIMLAFLGTPKVILLDEPLITIDQESLSILYHWIAEKNMKEHVSFLLSSHQSPATDDFNFSNEILVDQQTLKLIR